MGTDKRARQKANRATKKEELQEEAKIEHREESTRRIGKFVAIGAAILAIIVLISLLRGGGDDASDTITFAPTPAPETEEVAPEEIVLATEVPDDFEPFAGAGALAGVEPAARNNAYDSAPPMTIDATGSYAAVLNTDVGPIRLELFADEAPVTVNNFVNLALDGYYDGVVFHRVLEGFMAQGGDPTGTGTGGPGYSFEDEFSSGRVFDGPGQLAMANAGPATNGSQFFITFVPTPNLTGVHTIFGQLVGDPAILDEVARSDSGAPATVINSVRIIEG